MALSTSIMLSAVLCACAGMSASSPLHRAASPHSRVAKPDIPANLGAMKMRCNFVNNTEIPLQYNQNFVVDCDLSGFRNSTVLMTPTVGVSSLSPSGGSPQRLIIIYKEIKAGGTFCFTIISGRIMARCFKVNILARCPSLEDKIRGGGYSGLSASKSLDIEHDEGTVVHFSCPHGQLVGEADLTCGASGAWSDLPPTCLREPWLRLHIDDKTFCNRVTIRGTKTRAVMHVPITAAQSQLVCSAEGVQGSTVSVHLKKASSSEVVTSPEVQDDLPFPNFFPWIRRSSIQDEKLRVGDVITCSAAVTVQSGHVKQHTIKVHIV